MHEKREKESAREAEKEIRHHTVPNTDREVFDFKPRNSLNVLLLELPHFEHDKHIRSMRLGMASIRKIKSKLSALSGACKWEM